MTNSIDHPDQWFGGRTYSQAGADLVILNIFHRLQIWMPSYLDIGAHHPFELSDTALLYSRGCRGVNVEANPELIPAFNAERPEDTNVWAAILHPRNIGATPYTTLYRINETSGINTTIEGGLKAHGGFRDHIQVPACSINDILRNNLNNSWPDFIAIDAEGRDFEILESIDWDRCTKRPKVICVEAVSQIADISLDLRWLMAQDGYYAHSWCGGSMIFVQIELKPFLS